MCTMYNTILNLQHALPLIIFLILGKSTKKNLKSTLDSSIFAIVGSGLPEKIKNFTLRIGVALS